MRQILLWVLLGLTLAVSLCYVPPSLSAQGAAAAAVDPRVLADTAGAASAHVLVVFKSRTRVLDGVTGTQGWTTRGRVVYDTLRGDAEASQSFVRALLESRKITYQPYWIVNAVALEADRALVDLLAARPEVEAIEPDRAFRVPLETPTASAAPATGGPEWNLGWVHAPELWAQGITGQGRVIGIADTGVMWNHPALQPHYRGWNGTTADHNYNWWDAIRDNTITGSTSNPCGYALAVPCDDYGHGTHTTGINVGDDGAGNQIGMAPGAKWIACRNMDDGVGRPSTYIACLQFFLAPTDLNGQNADPSKRADVVSNSYGCPPIEQCSINSLQAAVDAMRAAGVFMAVSAGNGGAGGCSTVVDPPAVYGSAITVGATDYQSNAIASLSGRGPVTADGSNRRKPDLVAPGIQVRSSIGNASYGLLSGTSMAVPHVAGAVALLWSEFPTLRGDVAATQDLLQRTATHETTTEGCGGDSAAQVPNNTYGYGLLNVLAAQNLYLPLANLRWMPVIER